MIRRTNNGSGHDKIFLTRCYHYIFSYVFYEAVKKEKESCRISWDEVFLCPLVVERIASACLDPWCNENIFLSPRILKNMKEKIRKNMKRERLGPNRANVPNVLAIFSDDQSMSLHITPQFKYMVFHIYSHAFFFIYGTHNMTSSQLV